MLRLETKTGWWLVEHREHARLAGRFAEHWGNDRFAPPEPRAPVLLGISTHDDGWAVRDAAPQMTRAGLPSAFSAELVGKYSAFEEIDLSDYIAVRERAVAVVAKQEPYAGLLVSLHTYNLLTARADRSTIAPEQLPLLDAFLERQRSLQAELRAQIAANGAYTLEETSEARIDGHFRLLQATDNLSLLACVDHRAPATLLHPLPLVDGGEVAVAVVSLGERRFQLKPWPMAPGRSTLTFPARHITGRTFASAADLQAAYHAAPIDELEVTITS